MLRAYKPGGRPQLLLLSEEAISVQLPEEVAWWLVELAAGHLPLLGWPCFLPLVTLTLLVAPSSPFHFSPQLLSSFPLFLLFLTLIKTPALGKQQGWTENNQPLEADRQNWV